jgi:O-antigen ligase
MSSETISSVWVEDFSAQPNRLKALLAVMLSALLGFGLAIVIVSYPIPGMAIPLGLAALILFTRQPQYLLLAFFVSLAIPIQRSIFGLPLNASDGLLILWCLLWPLMMLRYDGPSRTDWHLPVMIRLVLPFVIAVTLAQLGSINPAASLKQVVRVIEWFVVLPLLMSALVTNSRFQTFAGVTLMLVPCIFAIDGIYEYFSKGETLTGMLGISVPIPEGSNSQIRHTFDISGRAGSSFGGAQGLAMYLVMTMSFAIAHLFYARNAWLRRVALLSLGISIAGLAVAQSRGGFIGAGAVVIVLLLITLPRLRIPFLVVSLFLGAITIAALGIWPNWDGTLAGLVPGRPEAVLDRMIIWGVVGEVFMNHPLFGVGLGNFRDAFFAREAWLHVDLAYPSLHAHNTYLEILADTGAVGLLTYLTFLVLVARQLVKLWHVGHQPILTLAAIGSLAAYAIFAAVDMLLLQNFHFLLILAVSLGIYQSNSSTLGVLESGAPEELR